MKGREGMSEVSALRAQIAQVDDKIVALETANRELKIIDCVVSAERIGASDLHVQGDKYYKQEAEENEHIEKSSLNLESDYQEATIDIVKTQIDQLNNLKSDLNSKLGDAIRRESKRSTHLRRR